VGAAVSCAKWKYQLLQENEGSLVCENI
jgi:hypothetical protein